MTERTFTARLAWSQGEGQWMATVDEHESLSVFADDASAALEGLAVILVDVLREEEGAAETAAILADPETMAAIAEGEADIAAWRVHSLDEVAETMRAAGRLEKASAEEEEVLRRAAESPRVHGEYQRRSPASEREREYRRLHAQRDALTLRIRQMEGLDPVFEEEQDDLREVTARLREKRVWVLTRYRELVSLHSTRTAAEASRAALIEADMAERARSGFQSVRDSADEPPDTDVIEVEIQP